MNSQQKEIYGARARVIKALAHPARLLVVDELAKGPMCVMDIRDKVGSDLSTVSKHLLVLKNAGVVADEKRGVQVFYRLHCPCVTDFFRCAESVLQINARDKTRVAGNRGRV